MGTPQPQVDVLTEDECWRYLESAYIGRLAVINGAVPEIFPVNFVPVDRSLLFRTAPGTKLRSLLSGAAVAFETDGLSTYSTEVWSVVAKGIPEPVPQGEAPIELADPDREPWMPGPKEHLIRIRPTEVSGRRFAVHSRLRWWPPLDFSSDWA